MPWSRPTLTQLNNQAQQDIASSPLGLKGFLRRAVMPILGMVQAGLAYLHYAYIDYIAQQAVPWTATDEWFYAWAALIGVYQKDATASSGICTFSGTAGETFPADQLITGGGLQFTSTAAATVNSAGLVTVPITCTTTGSAGNLAAGTSLTVASPVPGIAGSSGLVVQLTGGADQETFSAFKTRALQAYAAPPQGGDLADYVEWALAVPGVTRAWALPNGAGAGTVVVYVMLDEAELAYGGFPQGTNGGASSETRIAPATGDQLTVANSIFPEQPVTALVTACAPIKTPVPFTISGLGANNTAAMQAQIEAALAEMFLQQANVGGTLNPATMEAWPPIDQSAWYEAIGAIAGLSGFNVPTPSAALTPGTGQLFTLGICTFES
ncbi:MAG TPA: baseplate J/gp47 family protein [Rhodopila sp.]|jgi:uncharacterized phage protein gp47/JayE|nr:baseplate J/gp47 family protein [Rhodopila sp.]